MKEFVLKEKLSEALKDCKVLAVLVHSFNFDPKFFENYVMPLFVQTSGVQFRDEEIYNKIIWRSCAKEGLIPPISVYCDYYGKDNTTAPSLGYDIHCIRMPSRKGVIASFHPKDLFLLVKDAKEEEKLLVITGSGNLTSNGWCDNFECFSFETIKATQQYPNRVSTNKLQDYLDQVKGLSGESERTEAHRQIHGFLNYVNDTFPFFNSFENSFKDFIEQEVLWDNITELEIIAPYYSNDTKLITWLQHRGIEKIKCLIPTLRSNEVLLAEEIFLAINDTIADWCYWENDALNKAVRNLHAKIYRFYSPSKCYTVIGSINFTRPAWALFEKENNEANIESACLYSSKKDLARLLSPPAHLAIDQLRFIDKEDLEHSKKAFSANRNAPDIKFVIDWKKKELIVEAVINEGVCHFYQCLDDAEIKNGKDIIPLKNPAIKHFSKHGLIKIMLKIDQKTEQYAYYANQLNIETKPLGFIVNAYTILKYWQFLGDDPGKEKITEKLATEATNENGFIEEHNIEQKLLLNEMATHFQALVQLENYLFQREVKTIRDSNLIFKEFKYYLLNENVDTLSFYLKELEQQKQKGTIQKSFFWMVVQIINQNFYSPVIKWKNRNKIDKSEWRKFVVDVRAKKKELDNLAADLVLEIDGLKEKSTWVIDQLKKSYELQD